MEIDDEDPAWLEACMAAVNSIPEANLHSSSSAAGKMPASESSNSRQAAHQQQRTSRSSDGAPSNKSYTGGSRNPSAAIHYASHFPSPGSGTTAMVPQPSASQVAGRVAHWSHNRNDSNIVGSRVFRRKGVGISVSGSFVMSTYCWSLHAIAWRILLYLE